MSVLQRALRGVFGRQERSATFALVSTLVFGVALIAVHTHHEAWRDELHCWSIGRNAAGLWDVMTGDRRYDGHPFLWYYLLHLASRIHRGVVSLHALTIAIALPTAYLWLRYSQAPRVVRLLLLPSYLFFYEYSVVCRSYILGLLLLFVFCTLYVRAHVRYVALACVLTLLALTSAYGAFMSGGLAIFLFTRGVAVLRKDITGKRRLLALRPGYLSGLVTYLLGIALTAWSTRPPADEYFAQGWYFEQMGVENVKKAFVNSWWAFVPTSEDWSSFLYLGSDTPWAATNAHWLGAALLLLMVIALCRSPSVALSFAFVALVMGVFGQVKYPGGLRHVGNLFLFALACAWLARREVNARRSLWLVWSLLAFCLLVQIPSSYRAVLADWTRPFSGALEAARFLEGRYPRGTVFIGSNDFISSGVAGYMDRGIVFAETGDFGESVISHYRRASPTSASLAALAKENLVARERVVLMLSYPVSLRDPDVEFKQLLVTEPAIVPDERLWIYEARARAKKH